MGKIRGRDYISWLWQYTAPYAGRIGLLLLFGLLETFASLAMVQITKEIIDHATVGSGFGRLLTGYVLLLLGMQGISVLSTLLTALVTERFSFGIRRQIYEKILHSGWREVTAYHTGDLMTRLTSDAGNVADGIWGRSPISYSWGSSWYWCFVCCFIIPRSLRCLPCWWHRWQPCAPGGWENA